MRRIRVIPVLQIENRKLVKTTGFKSPKYVGDPLNALRIFNDKQVDEVAVIDIGATRNKKKPDFEFIKQLGGECFMPLSYGGGITSMKDATEIFQSGIEKIIVGTGFFRDPELVRRISETFGSQSVVVSVDVKRNWLGVKKVFVNHGTYDTGLTPVEYVLRAQKIGAGEILLQSVEQEGSGKGYDFDLIDRVSKEIDIPMVPLGGAATILDFLTAIQKGASGVAAGNMFIYKGPHKAVLINYPEQNQLMNELYTKV